MPRRLERMRPGGRLRPLLALLALAVVAGCGVHPVARRAHLTVHVYDRAERIAARLKPTRPTSEVLESEGLALEAKLHPERALESLAARNRIEPDADRTLALAELAYRTARGKPTLAREAAGRLYRDAACLAALVLNDPELGLPDPARIERATELHNRAVEQLVRLTWVENVAPGEAHWHDLLDRLDVDIECRSPYYPPARIESLTIASDYRVIDMQARYCNNGLGVPLVAETRRPPPTECAPEERFYPVHDWAAATAVMHPVGGVRGDAWRACPPRLALHDPFEEPRLPVGGLVLGLASDRTAPLALHNGNANFGGLAREGLLHSNFGEEGREGLFLLGPHRPGRIPVLLIHGLNSSPATWTQVFNHLRNDPDLGRRYEFWLYLYPTGRPVLHSAAMLRAAIRDARQAFDPSRSDPSWDQMVVVGHSMGGLLTKTLVQESGRKLWDGLFTKPYDQVKMPAEVQRVLNAGLFFERVPEVRRVVFIATPHRGSRVADRLPGRLATRLIRPTPVLEQSAKALRDLNGPDVLQPEFRHLALSSVGNLRFDNPMLRLIDSLPHDPTVPAHSIILQLGTADCHLPTDGVVPYSSAHLPWATSEVIVAGSHGDHQRREVTAELRRLLLIHLAGPDPDLARANVP